MPNTANTKPTLKTIIGIEPFISTYMGLRKDPMFQEMLTRSSLDELQICEKFIRRVQQRDRSSTLFKRATPSYWFGYSYQLLPVSSRMKITLSQTGILSERTRESNSTSVVAKVTLRTIKGESYKSVLIVNEGEQQDPLTFHFKGVYLELLRHAVIEFSIYLVKGFFKRKYLHSHWEVPLYRKDMSKKISDWKNISPL